MGGGEAFDCGLRESAGPVQDLAVPGAKMADLTDNRAGGLNPLTLLILRTRTQASAMIEAGPSLVSVWAGNNDALGPAESGDTTGMTSVPAFTTALDAVVAAVRTAAPLDAILIGVVDPLDFAPIVQPAPALYLARQANLIAKPVSASCAPGVGDSLLVSLEALSDAGLTTIDCAGGRYVLTPAEQREVHRRVDAFNVLIEARAAAGGWLYVDPNAVFAPQLGDPDAIRKCQGLAAARTPAELARRLNERHPGLGLPTE